MRCSIHLLVFLLSFLSAAAMPNNKNNNSNKKKDKDGKNESPGDLVPPPAPTVAQLRLLEDDIDRIKTTCAKKNCKDVKKEKKDRIERRKGKAKSLLARNARLRGKKEDEAVAEADEIAKLVLEIKKLKLEEMGLNPNDITPADDGIVQKDVLVTIEQARSKVAKLRGRGLGRGRGNGRRRKRSSVCKESFPTLLWTMPIKVIVPSAFSSAEQQMLRNALNTMSTSVGCIQFNEVQTASGPHITFEKIDIEGVCGASVIGKVSVNVIYVNFACTTVFGSILHEIMHSLGVDHHHARLDRDDHIKINWDNLDPTSYDWFAKSDLNQYTTYGSSYTPLSVMHYGAFAGAVNATIPSIEPLDSGVPISSVGQRLEMKPQDIELLKRAYCCTGTCVDSSCFCGYWANANFCNNSTFGPWMELNCRKSCGLCSAAECGG